ncbi:superoxide dismutase family protein [Thalassobacillus hwangdonensis]|uniref:Superoxide dismutase [Cu-Zn] n=1 Tax=Thalassobacillus hwangdonensis TaxID=546108 RepID=A0ABW3KXW0_9BACI
MYYTYNPYSYYYPSPYPYSYVRQQPFRQAYAVVEGGPLAPDLKGIVYFYELPNGVQVFVQVEGLPAFQPATNGKSQVGPHGFHIHENGACDIGDENDPFQAAGGHWNPDDQPHGNHAGDFPVLFSNNGVAQMLFYTNRFTLDQIEGKAVIIHESPDDFQSQPSGNAGKRLACGVIRIGVPNE